MKSLVQHILSLVSHPILSFLYRWIYDGELEDTYHEVSAEACGLRAWAPPSPDCFISVGALNRTVHTPHLKAVHFWHSATF